MSKDVKQDATFVFSLSGNHSATEWQKVVRYMDYIVSKLPALQIAVITHSPRSHIAWKLNTYTDVTALRKVIT